MPTTNHLSVAIREVFPVLMETEHLATLLNLDVRTTYNRQQKRPETLPPRVNLPGIRGPRYLLDDVVAWLLAHRQEPSAIHPQPAAPRRRGRPRKATNNQTK